MSATDARTPRKEYLAHVDIQISPRMLCPCGKTTRALTTEERETYNLAIRRMERREAEEAGTKANELVN